MSGLAPPDIGIAGLFERAWELERLTGLLEPASRGSGVVAVVEGPAGIGKSGVLTAVRGQARAQGFAVITARGSEFEAGMAFGVARQLFEPMLRAASPAELRRLLAGVAKVAPRALGAETGEAPADSFAAIHSLYWLCANRVDSGPVMVVVDDVQWSDEPSLAWLGYLARRAADLRLALLLGLRSGDPGGDRDELAQVLGDELVVRIPLGPMSATGVDGIVRAQFDDVAEPEFCAACLALTHGNPLFVRELLTAAVGEGLSGRASSVADLRRIAPAAVGPSVLARLGRMGSDALALARAVAVLGAGVEVGTAAELAGLDPELAELTADRLAATQIFAPVRPLEFFHPLISAAVREDLAPGARRLAHRRAATLLDAQGPAARVAAHLLACGPAGDGWVVERLRNAAVEALDRGAPEIAATYLRRALAERSEGEDHARLLLLLGTAEWRAGEPDAIVTLEQALAAAASDENILFGVCSVLVQAYYVSDQAERSIDVLERALAVAGDGNPDLALRFEAGIVGVGMMNDRTARAALDRAEGLRDRLIALPDAPVHLLATLSVCAVRANRIAEAEALAERALACRPYPPPMELCNILISTLTLIECYDAAGRLCRDLLVAARGRSALQEMVGISAARASALLDCGALSDAAADANWALERADGVRRVHATIEVVRVLIERDDIDQAAAVLGQVADPEGSGSVEAARLLWVRGRLRSAQGRLQESLEDFTECGQRCDRLGIVTQASWPWRSEAALVHAALGNREHALRLARRDLDLARGFARPRTLGVSLRAYGLVERGEAGLELLSEAVEALQGSDGRLELARALTDHGAALRRAGRRARARAQLEAGLDLAYHLGARRIANQARAELIAAGAKPRRDATTGRDALTAGELRVARLAAEGMSNREIAQALFISLMTAKAHLHRVYRKLGITSRGQLAAAFAGRAGDMSEGQDRAARIIS
jgi:DNA-binding CsgD family transcriptional regulator